MLERRAATTWVPPHRLGLAVVVVLGVLSARAAVASGFIMPSKGGKAQGMAGAWVAGGDDLGVMDHNPAELARIERPAIELHYTLYNFLARFDPAPHPLLGDGPETANVADQLNHIPNFYGMLPLGEHWRVGAGVFSPVGPRHTYLDSGPQRYQMQRARIQLAWATVAGVWVPDAHWSVSLSLDIGLALADQRMAVGLVPGFRSLDGYLHLQATGKPAPRPKLGLLWRIDDHWSLGLVAAPGIPLEVEGDVVASIPQLGLTPENAHDRVVASQWYPGEARFGVAWRGDGWGAELALRYYRWSRYTEQRVDLERNELAGIAIPDLTVPKHYRDAGAVQVGLRRRLGAHELRAGYMFDQQANQDEGLTIQDFDAPKHVLALGYGYRFGDWERGDATAYELNLSANHVIYVDRPVADSASQPIGILATPEGLGDGTYDWSVQMLSLSFGVRFR